VLWALARELRTLYQCAEQVEQGLGIDRALQNNRVWDRRKPITKTALKRLQSQQLGKLLQLANRIDQAVKGINQDNEWDLLEQLLVATAAKPALPLTRT
jgi:DNA polymerase-3 subunit delta